MALTDCIIQSREVIELSGMYPPASCPVTFRDRCIVERYVMTRCFSKTYYETLLKDMIDYTPGGTPGSIPWDADTSVLTGEAVTFRGKIYVALSDLTPPVPEPPTAGAWQLAPRFATEALENFWCDYLAPWVALNIMYRKLPFIRAQVSSHGVIQFNGESYKPADGEAINALYHGIAASLAMRWANIRTYAAEQLQVSTTGCGPTGQDCGQQQARRHAYRIA